MLTYKVDEIDGRIAFDDEYEHLFACLMSQSSFFPQPKAEVSCLITNKNKINLHFILKKKV